MRARRDQEDGAAAVEAALVLTFIVLPLVFAIISWAYMLSFRQALSQAAAEGARAAVSATTGAGCSAAGPYDPANCPAQSFAANGVANSMQPYGMACNVGHLTCTIAPPAPCANGSGTCITVTVNYPYRDNALLTVPVIGYALPANLGFTSTVQVG